MTYRRWLLALGVLLVVVALIVANETKNTADPDSQPTGTPSACA
jgi:hypothetical protein